MELIKIGFFIAWVWVAETHAYNNSLIPLNRLETQEPNINDKISYFPSSYTNIRNAKAIEYYKKSMIKELFSFAKKNINKLKWQAESYFFQSVALYLMGKKEHALLAIQNSLSSRSTNLAERLRIIILHKDNQKDRLEWDVMNQFYKFGLN